MKYQPNIFLMLHFLLLFLSFYFLLFNGNEAVVITSYLIYVALIDYNLEM